MRRLVLLLVFSLLAPAVAHAQGSDDAPLTPPPLVPAVPEEDDGPPPAPPLPVGVDPRAVPKAHVPGQPQTGYPYSPAPAPFEKPGPEIGLIVSESLFSMLTAAGVTLLPYFLLLRPIEVANYNGGSASIGIDPAVGTIIFIVLFAAVPLAVSQTVVSIANGSRAYSVESWPAALVGLGVEALAVALYFLMQHDVNPANGVTAKEWLLLLNTVVLVPLTEVLITNLLKKPKLAAPAPAAAALNYSPRTGLSAGLPVPSPLFGQVAGTTRSGVMFPLFSGVL